MRHAYTCPNTTVLHLLLCLAAVQMGLYLVVHLQHLGHFEHARGLGALSSQHINASTCGTAGWGSRQAGAMHNCQNAVHGGKLTGTQVRQLWVVVQRGLWIGKVRCIEARA